MAKAQKKKTARRAKGPQPVRSEATKSASWRGIRQSSSKRKAQRPIRWGRLLRAAAIGVLVAAILAVLSLSLWQLSWSVLLSLSQHEDQAVLKRVYFETNGVLDEAWLEPVIEPLQGTAIESIDIDTLRQRLESVGQVAQARVVRVYPDSLRILLKEHSPVVRLAVPSGPNGAYQLLLVSDQGVVYKGINVPAASLRRMPFLGGASVQRMGEGYAPVPGMPMVHELLELGRQLLPQQVGQWQVVDISRFSGQAGQLGDVLMIRTQSGEQLILPTEHFEHSLRRLERIYEERSLGNIPAFNQIDLALYQPVLSLEPTLPAESIYGPRR